MVKRFGPYLEQQIQSANPLNLICISYRSAIQAIRDARTALAENDIPERVIRINLAHSILAELYSALDFTAGDGKLVTELGRLYEYMMRRLIDANTRKDDHDLAEVLALLSSISESWEQLAAQSQPSPPAPAPSASPKVWETMQPQAEPVHYSFSF